jgi:ferrochelatase
MSRKAVLLMAYGSPENVDEVGDYFTHIRRGVRPSGEFIEKISARYRAVGGKTPLLKITKEEAAALGALLDARRGKGAYKVFIGMKHWHPFIKDTLEEIKKEGIEEVIAIALAPHYSKMSIGGYQKFLDEAKGDLKLKLVESWHTNPKLIECISKQILEKLTQTSDLNHSNILQNIRMILPKDFEEVHIIFTAHSLPEKIREWNDPYESQILETAELVMKQLIHSSILQNTGMDLRGDGSKLEWSVAYQSMGQTGEPWIGPHLLEKMTELKNNGVKAVLVVPIGFVSDNLEINYDIDIEAQNKARELGIKLARTKMRNTEPLFIEALYSLVLENL